MSESLAIGQRVLLLDHEGWAAGYIHQAADERGNVHVLIPARGIFLFPGHALVGCAAPEGARGGGEMIGSANPGYVR